MQGLSDGYFVLPYTVQNYLADQFKVPRYSTDLPEFLAAEKEVRDQLDRLLNVKGKKSVDTFHRELGKIMWENVGMGRNKERLEKALKLIPELREEFWKDVRIPGTNEELNNELQKAHRLADYFELGELIALDALKREESCGGHFREEFQTPEGEALRNDVDFAHVAAWEYKGPGKAPELHKEKLIYEFVELKQRNYK